MGAATIGFEVSHHDVHLWGLFGCVVPRRTDGNVQVGHVDFSSRTEGQTASVGPTNNADVDNRNRTSTKL